jgi:hypothetical protein
MRRISPSAFILLLAFCLAACAPPRPDAAPAAPDAPAPEAGASASAGDASQPMRPAPQPVAAVPGLPDLDRSCRADSDCAVKNVGNCCGYFPACVNTAAQPDPAAVQAACAEAGVAGVCGFRDIEACACVANTCEPAQPVAGVAR